VLSPPPIDAPLALYAALIDAPDVLAAAAARLGIADETAARRSDGGWELRSPRGAHAVYRVLRHAPDRRVVLGYGHAVVWGFEIPGTVLGVLDLDDRAGAIRQRLAVRVRLESAVWRLIGRLAVVLLPGFVDQKLIHGFRAAAAVATWAARDRPAFCTWLGAFGLASPDVARAADCAASAPPTR
jgi:hypothetical protein